jgi:hypothetical protein
MNTISQGTCAACRRTIDAAARICPFCGADPDSGERPVETDAIIEEVFRPRTMSTSANILDYARHRQGVVIAGLVLVAFVLITLVHQFATRSNAGMDSDTPAVPLTEITDVTQRADEVAPVEMPELNFEYDGDPKSLRTFIVEPGAVPPPEVVAAQQAAQQATQPQAAAPPPSGADRQPAFRQQPRPATPAPQRPGQQ